MAENSIRKIGIAIIEQDGSYLLGTRGEGQVLAGKTEFPGGKCEEGETIQECLVRESLEETGLLIIPVEELENKSFTYPHGTVDLHFWICSPKEPASPAPVGYFWVKASKLKNYSFPEANQSVIEKLISRNE